MNRTQLADVRKTGDLNRRFLFTHQGTRCRICRARATAAARLPYTSNTTSGAVTYAACGATDSSRFASLANFSRTVRMRAIKFVPPWKPYYLVDDREATTATRIRAQNADKCFMSVVCMVRSCPATRSYLAGIGAGQLRRWIDCALCKAVHTPRPSP